MEYFTQKFGKQINYCKDLYKKHESYVPAFFFSLGFLLDVLTLGEIDDLGNILMLGFYVAISLFFLGYEYSKKEVTEESHPYLQTLFKYKTDIFHFILGAMLSAFTLFYFKSGSVANSFFFLMIMAFLLILNELEVFQEKGIIIRTCMTMLCFVSYLIYIIPILFGEVSSLIFYLALIIAFFCSAGAFFFLTKYNQNQEQNLKELFIPHCLVLICFFCLYSFKVLPPVPLSIKYVGIYHNVTKTEFGYQTQDLKPWWKFWHNGDQDFTARQGDRVYIFTNIFAPGGFAGEVYLRWMKDTEDGYVTSDRIPIKITGGRDKGFRGYAYKKNYTAGDWLIKIETADKLEIGRISFTIKKDKSSVKRKFRVSEL